MGHGFLNRTEKIMNIKIYKESWKVQLTLWQYIWVWMFIGNNWIFGVGEWQGRDIYPGTFPVHFLTWGVTHVQPPLCVLLHLHSALSLVVEQISICILFREFYIKNMFLIPCLRGRLCSAWPFILALLICLPILSHHAEQLNRKVNALLITFLFILLRDSWSAGSLQVFFL